MNSETCQRMSAARQGRAMPRQVRAKMSRSHLGLKHSNVSFCCSENQKAVAYALRGLSLQSFAQLMQSGCSKSHQTGSDGHASLLTCTHHSYQIDGAVHQQHDRK